MSYQNYSADDDEEEYLQQGSQVIDPQARQLQFLNQAKETAELEGHKMVRCLDKGNIYDALHHAALMLGELRTSSLTPKNYYALCRFQSPNHILM